MVVRERQGGPESAPEGPSIVNGDEQNAILEWPEIITDVHGQAKIEEPTLFLR